MEETEAGLQRPLYLRNTARIRHILRKILVTIHYNSVVPDAMEVCSIITSHAFSEPTVTVSFSGNFTGFFLGGGSIANTQCLDGAVYRTYRGLCAYVLETRMSCAKTAELIETPCVAQGIL